MKKVIIVLGTRPEAIKLLPVYHALRKFKDIRTILVSTGQHREMLSPIFELFGVKPDIDMEVMTRNQSLEWLSAQVVDKCAKLYEAELPELVIVQGDTTTAMAAAMAAFYRRVPIAHVEAGLRSRNIYSPFPEEVNRRIIALVAALHFAPTKSAADVINREHVFGKVYNVGNTVIDALYFAARKISDSVKPIGSEYSRMIQNFEKVVVITGHRRENFGTGLASICKAIRDLASMFPGVSWIYPVHLNPNVREIVFKELGDQHNIFLIDPVPYHHMVYLMTKCYFVITDSGGIQEEAPALGKPVIIMRDTTERPEGVKAGTSMLAGSSTSKIVRAARQLLTNTKTYNKMAKAKNPYGKGDSADKIARTINSFLAREGKKDVLK